MTTTADDIAARVFSLLSADAGVPEGLTVLDAPDLPMDPLELPVVGVYLEDGERPHGEDEGERTCIIRVEVRAMGKHPARATRSFRDWVVSVLTTNFRLSDATGSLSNYVNYMGFKPFASVEEDEWMAGALMDFEYVYFWEPTNGQ